MAKNSLKNPSNEGLAASHFLHHSHLNSLPHQHSLATGKINIILL